MPHETANMRIKAWNTLWLRRLFTLLAFCAMWLIFGIVYAAQIK